MSGRIFQNWRKKVADEEAKERKKLEEERKNLEEEVKILRLREERLYRWKLYVKINQYIGEYSLRERFLVQARSLYVEVLSRNFEES
ncbi:hypothetical protein [Rivularia sp. UHCC 0363]|uniref:hypothetical protein n=1 Tax=Rivularia sp. UHCC 0363 TaxID=3110244 RepID=UPI002B204573|nr:hypothetical protein [Rivularia sp. UHCC 0363]MEA5595570.1 hypothetical protein [Rivularia sp. UHCC 0363]